ncbi:MAG: M56 family metallopeptidase [Chitinophagaceae bacterium]
MFIFLMNTIMQRIISAFSWMLIHSLWQGLVLAVCTSAMLMITKKWKAAAKYNLVLIMLTGFLVTCMFTFAWEWNNGYTEKITGPGLYIPQLFFGNLRQVMQIIDNCNAYFAAHEQLIVTTWFVISGSKIIKMLGAMWYNQRMKSNQVSIPDAHWKNTLHRLCSTLQIDKAVVLLESAYMKIPVVIGHLKPIILMPAGLLTSLPADQAEAILMHELAHIRRNDYLVNFLQHIVETVFFFNPALLWVSSWIREERENCCDDITLAETQNKMGLAEALISFKQHQLYGASYHTAFPGKKDQLLRRVNRILGSNKKPASLTEKIFFLMSFILLLAGACTVALVHGRGPAKKDFSETKNKMSAAIPEKYIVHTALQFAVQKELLHKVIKDKNKIRVYERTAFFKKEPDEITEVTPDHTASPLTDQQMALLGMKQAEMDQLQAVRDMARARMDQDQALRDQKQAIMDQKQANKNQYQAKLDQQQAMKDQADARLQREQSRIDEQQAFKNKKEAERKKLQNQTII